MGGFRGSVSARWVKAEMHITCLLHAVDPPARRATGTSCWYRGSASSSPRASRGYPLSTRAHRRRSRHAVARERAVSRWRNWQRHRQEKMTVSLLDISGDDIARLGDGGLRDLVAGFAKRKCGSGDFRL